VRPTIARPIICCFGILLTLPVTSTAWAQTHNSPSTDTGTSTQDSADDLLVSVGKSVLVDSAHKIERISVGSSEIAEATAISPSEVLINGKAAGETSLILWQAGGARQFFNVKVRTSTYVVSDRLESVRRELRTELPGQTLRVSTENGSVFLRGTVKDLTSSDRAMQIAATAGKVVNLLYVAVPAPEPQILLRVRFASLDRTTQRQLGVNVFSTGATNSIGSVSTGQFSPPTISNIPGTANAPTSVNLSNLLNIFIFRPDLNLGATIAALETKGVLQILAEPNLLTSNGKQGSFLAGGEYPYPVVQGAAGTGSNAVTVQFKEFGVRLNFIPTITPRGTIRLQVAPEVSSLDFTNGLTISGFTVPALSTRRVRTEVELGQGQSFAIAGLLDNRETRNLSKVPFIGDIPILGKFFQSIQKSKTNTELMVIVTPEIVSPLAVGEPLPELKYPDQFMQPMPGMATLPPGSSPATANATPVRPPTIPVEQLVQSMQPEQPLSTNSVTPGAIYSQPQVGAGSTGPAPTAPQ
jgi:pilus assembly protein CpaC